MKNKTNQKFVKLVVISILILFLTTSATSAVIKSNNPKEDSTPPISTFYENYYEWKDDFNNEQKIDSGQSYNYEVSGGEAKIKDTFPIWTDPDWERMMPITVSSNGNYEDIAVNFLVEYDTDMKSDFGDVRFKHEDFETNFLDYWRENYEPSDWASFWVLVPEMQSGTNMMYMFYKNENASYEGDFGDVFTDWEEEWANDEQITYKGGNKEGCWDPDVSYGNGEFLVCWEQGMPYAPLPPWNCPGFRQEIKASIYEPDGDRIVFNKFVFKDDNVDWWRNENPSIDYGGGKWFVAWDHYAADVKNPSITTMDIYARTVQRSGSDLNLGGVIKVCEAQNCQADPNVQYDSENNQFLIVWEDGRDGTGDYDIRASIYTPSGSVVVDEKNLCNDANSQCEPWAAYDPGNEQYFIVWEDGVTADNGPFRIMGGLFDDSLNNIDTFVVAEPNNYPNDDIDYNFPCVEFDDDSERYLVTWQDDDISDGVWRGDIYGKIYDTAGNVEVDEFTIRTGSFERTDIVPYLTEAFFVAFDNEAKVYGRLVTSEGLILGGDVQLSASPSAKADWTNIATDGSEIWVTWEDKRLEYPYPYDGLPDAFGNIWNLNIPSGNEITYTFGEEKQFISEAQVTSIVIEPENLEKWHEFQEDSTGTITFDILDSTGNIILLEDVTSGQDLSTINPLEYPGIRLRAFFTRNNPTYTPKLDSWTILYEGLDLEPPVTKIDSIDGTWVPSVDWWTSESVTIWLKAIDYPEDTGSGVDATYYTLDGGQPEMYIEGSGIHLSVVEPEWWDIWEVNFWSVDKEGNVEDRTKPANFRTIRIDAAPPYVEITEPANEQKVNTPFWVRADATDNYEIDHVEFDIEPFGKRPGLPWEDHSPPYEWECNEEPMARTRSLTDTEDPNPAGVNVMVRAQVYDVTGQTWIHEIWVYIENWNPRGARQRTISNFRSLLKPLKLGIVIDNKLNIDIPTVEDADSVKFVATKIITRKQIIIWDNDFSNGCSASFDITTGFYRITTTTYKENEEIASDLASRVLFIHKR